jgi:hypothetical protein
MFQKNRATLAEILLIPAQKAANLQNYVVTTIDRACVNRVAYMYSRRSGSEPVRDVSGLPHSQRVGFVEVRSEAGRMCKHKYCLLGTANERETMVWTKDYIRLRKNEAFFDEEKK